MKNFGKGIFKVLQQVGKALMLPVAILPAAGLLLALGSALQQESTLHYLPFLDAHFIQRFAEVMAGCGDVIFANLPLIFAVGVAIGLAGGEGAAALAAIVAYLIMNKGIGLFLNITPEMATGDPQYALVLGIPTLATGVFGGIMVGLLAAWCFNKFHQVELPPYLGFFAGKRLVPIMGAALALPLAGLLCIIWPPIGNFIREFSQAMIDSNTVVAAFVFGFVERALVPFGLHHIWYTPFWYEFGSYTTTAGDIVHGDQSIWFAQLKDGVEFTSGYFMQGKFIIMMFGLPAAALAMYHTVKDVSKKKFAAGVYGSGGFTSFLTGITEPIEFTFLFVVPLLYVWHCFMAGVAFALMAFFGLNLGLTFSGGLIDFFFLNVLPNKEPWWIAILIGIGYAFVYYFTFRWVITKFMVKIPGRDDDEVTETGSVAHDDVAAQTLEALGGAENITFMEACITRLRVNVKDKTLVASKNRFKELGASGVMEVGDSVQVIFGPKAERICTNIKHIMAGRAVKPITIEDEPKAANTAVKIAIASPLTGKLRPITAVPDPVFAEKMMGDGFAIEPTEGLVVSPVDGKIATIFPTKHAIGLITPDGVEILVHMGIDTVSLNGEGFKLFVEADQEVKQGDKLAEMDLDYISKNASSTVTPIIFTNLMPEQSVVLGPKQDVKRKDQAIVSIQ